MDAATSPMTPLDEALDRVIAGIEPTQRTENAPLSDALHRICAKTILARIPHPGFDNSAMDGYAVRSADAQSAGSTLKVAGEQPAGIKARLEVRPGEAIRIFTGAPMPAGADVVVMQEDTAAKEDGTIEITEPSEPGEFIRKAGSDICRGQAILEKGARLNAASIALLASQGIGSLEVFALPRVAIVTTGDELIESGRPLQPGQIYNSNGPMLSALVREVLGPQGVLESHHLPDDKATSTALLARLREQFDFIILSGGVSVGEHDHIKTAAQDAGFEGQLWRIRMKPGKPLFFARAPGCLLFGLPGNPVSTFVTFKIFTQPSLRRWAGVPASALSPPRTRATLSQSLENKGDRPHFLRMILDSVTGEVRPAGPQQSHALANLGKSNCLLEMDAQSRLNRGTEVFVQLI